MNLFLLNILLAVMWMLFWGWPSLYTFVAGFALGYIVLGLVSRAIDLPRNYATAGWDLFRFFLYFIKILVQSNIQVAQVVLHPRLPMSPRFFRYNVANLNDVQITTLANAITLTPGTLSVDVSNDGRWLYIHAMTAADRDAVVQSIDELRDQLLRLVFTPGVAA